MKGCALCLMAGLFFSANSFAQPKFQEANGIISIEAEYAKEIVGWALVQGSSGNALQDTSDRNLGYMTYDINFQTPGNYYMFLYCLAPNKDTSKNDCFVFLNEEKLYAADDSTRPDGMRVHTAEFSWTFYPKGPGGHTPPIIKHEPVYALVEKPGIHTLKIVSRSKGFTLDKIVLKLNDPNKPAGTGPAETIAE